MRGTAQPMRTLAILLVALGFLVQVGCYSSQCLAKCVGSVTVHIQGPSGEPVTRFSGTAQVDGLTYEFNCPGVSAVALCNEVGVRLDGANGRAPSIDLEVSTPDGELAFVGTLPIEDSTERETCGATCGVADVHVELGAR